MNLDFNTVSDQPSYIINADFNSSAVIKSAASMGLDSAPRDFSVLKVASANQAKIDWRQIWEVRCPLKSR